MRFSLSRLAATCAGLWVAAAPVSALACLPPPPVSESEQAAANAARQAGNWEAADLVVEYEVLAMLSQSPGQSPDAPPPPTMAYPSLRVQLTPVRTLKGDGAARPVDIVYQAICGFGPAYSTTAGTRLVAYSRTGAIAAPEDMFDLMAVSEIAHPATLAALASED